MNWSKMEQETKTKYAFISYNHKDQKVAKWLHRKLESYKLPAEIHNEFDDSRYLRPVFRDQTDLDSGVLSDELHRHLSESKFLIVICSKHSADSRWVSNEVRFFTEQLGRFDYIIPLLVDVNESEDVKDYYPAFLRQYIEEQPDRELLGINLNDGGCERAFVRVVARMLGVSFDELWHRHERQRRQRIAIACITVPIGLFLLYWLVVPISLTVRIKDDYHSLPLPSEAVVVVNGMKYRIHKLDTVLTIGDIPGYYRGRHIPIGISAPYYEKIDTNVQIGWGGSNEIQLSLHRDESFAVYSGVVIDNEDGRPVENALVEIEDKSDMTDNNGCFRIRFSLKEQTTQKEIRVSHPDYEYYQRQDEHPGQGLNLMLIRR